MSYIVTGGCGFIGSNFVNFLARTTDRDIIVIDSLTYAGKKSNIDGVFTQGDRVRIIEADISKDVDIIDQLFQHNNIEKIFHFAAESHVDNSIGGPDTFVQTNVVGTFNLLNILRKREWPGRFVHISTDEVYGALTESGPSFTECMRLDPNNVYSATKASADLLVRSFYKTYGIDVVTTRCCNNYGPRQHVEKLVPKVISNAINEVPIPVYGKGDNVREWIYVDDHCMRICDVADLGESGSVYNIGSGIEISNVDLVKKILTKLNKPFSLIKFVNDRPGHDFRYSIDCSKLDSILAFECRDVDTGLDETINWYKAIFK